RDAGACPRARQALTGALTRAEFSEDGARIIPRAPSRPDTQCGLELKRPTSGKIRGRAHPCFRRHWWTAGSQARFADGLYLGNDRIAAWRAFACAIGSCPPPSPPPPPH